MGFFVVVSLRILFQLWALDGQHDQEKNNVYYDSGLYERENQYDQPNFVN